MSVTRFIFTLYVLFLAVSPCPDMVADAGVSNAGIAVAGNIHHQTDSADEDYCTPFCICSCCLSHIQPHQSADVFFAPAVHFKKAATLSIEKPLLGNGSAVWQPPKIS